MNQSGQEMATRSIEAGRAQVSVPADGFTDIENPHWVPPRVEAWGEGAPQCRWRLDPLGGEEVEQAGVQAAQAVLGWRALTTEHPSAQLPDVLLTGFSALKSPRKSVSRLGAPALPSVSEK